MAAGFTTTSVSTKSCSAAVTNANCTQLGCKWRNNQCVLVGTEELLEGQIAADFTGAVGGATDANAIDRNSKYSCYEGCVVRAPLAVPACATNANATPNDPACYFRRAPARRQWAGQRTHADAHGVGILSRRCAAYLYCARDPERLRRPAAMFLG